MSYKVVRDANGNVMACGPNNEHYEPTVGLGQTLYIEDSQPAPTQSEQFKAIERAIEQHMDSIAQADNWDDRKSFALRAGYAGPWQAKGIAFGQWMDSCWSIAIQAQADVIAGTRPMPTPEQAVAELPVMVW